MMNEILTCIKLIKMYAWENAFAAAIGKLRIDEKAVLQVAGFLQVCIQSLPIAWSTNMTRV